MKRQRLMTVGLVLSVSMFSSISCLGETDETAPNTSQTSKSVKGGKKIKSLLKDANTLRKEGLGKPGDTKGLVNKKITGKAQGQAAQVLYGVWGGGYLPVMASDQGQAKTLEFMQTVTGRRTDLTLRQATEDNFTSQAPPGGNYYDDPRLAQEREKLLQLERKIKNDPDVADNCKKQITDILRGYNGIRSPYDAEAAAAPAETDVRRFDGSYSGSYGGDSKGPVAFTVANGAITIRQPGSGSGTVSSSGSASFSGSGTLHKNVSFTFTGTFSLSPGGRASASGSWSGVWRSRGTWRASP